MPLHDDPSSPIPDRPVDEDPGGGTRSPDRLWAWAIAAGLLAGLLTWAGGEVVWGRVLSSQRPKIIPFPTAEDRDRVIMGQVRSTSTSFIQQGAALGIVFGLAGGLARRSPRAMLAAALVGGLLGAVAATGAAYVILPVYYRNVEPQENALAIPLLTHGTIWAAAGAAAGLALGVGLGGRGRWWRCAVGGLLGGAAGTVVYELLGAIAFPVDKTSQPVSATVVTRLIAHLAVGLLAAAGAAMAADPDALSRRPPATERDGPPASAGGDEAIPSPPGISEG